METNNQATLRSTCSRSDSPSNDHEANDAPPRDNSCDNGFNFAFPETEGSTIPSAIQPFEERAMDFSNNQRLAALVGTMDPIERAMRSQFFITESVRPKASWVKPAARTLAWSWSRFLKIDSTRLRFARRNSGRGHRMSGSVNPATD